MSSRSGLRTKTRISYAETDQSNYMHQQMSMQMQSGYMPPHMPNFYNSLGLEANFLRDFLFFNFFFNFSALFICSLIIRFI